MDPITIILGIFALIGSIAFAARDRQDQKKANQEVMDFNAEEAEKSRDWQEEQYKKYESVASQMQQRQQAGLNPHEGITSMSVGSGSTASTSANQISPLSKTDFSLFSQIPGMSTQVKQTKLQNKLIGEQIEGVKLDNEAKIMENIKLAIEADDYASYYSLVKEGLAKGNQLTDEQIKKAYEEARKAKEDADQFEEFGDNGGNTYTDSSNLSASQTALNEANTNTVNALREHLVEVQKATADSLKASASLAREQCNKTKEETEKLSDEDKKRTWDVTIGQFFGLADISILAPELQAKAADYYWDFQHGKYSYESTITAFQDQINRYVEKNGHIVQSTSVNSSMGIKIGPISGNASAGKSGTY